MPLNRPALSVGPGPRSVQEARRWVIRTITDIGRSELSETSELGVSELVTNALLHGDPPITVRVRGTRDHPRVEVRDGSTEAPVVPEHHSPAADLLPAADLDEDSLLVTFGRGLDIVSRCADAWGAEIEDEGKIMWFAPSAATRDQGAPATISGIPPAPVTPDPNAMEFLVRGAPLKALEEFDRHHRELRREVRLLSFSAEEDYPLAKHLSDLFGSLQRELSDGIDQDHLDEARQSGQDPVDLTILLAPDSAASMGRFVELLDFADEFCRRERLLSLARTPEQRAFQTWFLTEFVRQQAGRPPLPWSPENPWRAQA